MIVLTSQTYDLEGAIEVEELPSSDLDTHERRVNRVQTLDGGVVFTDGGYSYGDRTLRINWRPTQTQADAVGRLHRLYPVVNVFTRHGAYEGAISQVTSRGGEQSITVLVKGELS